MLKPREANELMAKLLRKPLTAESHKTRLLREAGRDYWAKIGTGRDGSVTTRHLACSVLADALAPGQPSEAPRALTEIESLRPHTGSMREATDAPMNALLGLMRPTQYSEFRWTLAQPADESLIELVCSLVRRMVEKLTGDRSKFPFPTIRVTLGVAGDPMTAEVEWPTEQDGKPGTLTHFYSVNRDVLPGLNLPEQSWRRGYRTQVVIGETEILSLAAIAVETGEYSDRVQIAPGSEPGQPTLDLTASDTVEGTPTPETTKAAELPGSNDLHVERPAKAASPNKAQSNPNTASKQSASCTGHRESQGFQPPSLARTRHYGPYRNDIAAAQAG